MSAKVKRGPWSPEDTRRLRKIAASRPRGRRPFSAREAAALLKRSPGAVRFKAMVEGVHFRCVVQPRGLQVKLGRRRRKYGMRATLRGGR